jgi:predicted hotdog family 3-hydroxylacyl-ACP dehydratase
MHWLDGAELSADETIRAWRTITNEHPFTDNGHFLPAALIELMAQAAAAGAIQKATAAGRTLRRGVLAAIHDVRITGPVHVGDTVIITGREEKSFAGFVSGTLEARVGQTLVAQGRMTFHLSFE